MKVDNVVLFYGQSHDMQAISTPAPIPHQRDTLFNKTVETLDQQGTNDNVHQDNRNQKHYSKFKGLAFSTLQKFDHFHTMPHMDEHVRVIKDQPEIQDQLSFN